MNPSVLYTITYSTHDVCTLHHTCIYISDFDLSIATHGSRRGPLGQGPIRTRASTVPGGSCDYWLVNVIPSGVLRPGTRQSTNEKSRSFPGLSAVNFRGVNPSRRNTLGQNQGSRWWVKDTPEALPRVDSRGWRVGSEGGYGRHPRRYV